MALKRILTPLSPRFCFTAIVLLSAAAVAAFTLTPRRTSYRQLLEPESDSRPLFTQSHDRSTRKPFLLFMCKKKDNNNIDSWNKQHLAHGADEVHEETPVELKESENAAVWDAYDAASDAGMEAASEERAVMMANEYAHLLKEKAKQKKKQNEQAGDKDHDAKQEGS